MKKHLFTIAAVAFALCACQKAETGTNEVTPGVNEEVGVTQQILIGTNLKSSELVTKASVEDWNDVQNVYVIGYNNAEIGSASGEVAAGDVFIMPNVKATVTSVATGEGENPKGELSFDEKFYYDEDVKSYGFVGYYLGEGVEGAPVAGDGTLTVPFTIDGDQDVLAAITDIENDRKFYDEEEGRERLVSKDYVYSAFAARRKVQPTLLFSHMLTKFSFNVKYGSEGSEETPFYLDSLTLTTKTAGTLTLNSANISVASTGDPGTVTLITPDVSFTLKDLVGKSAGDLMVLPGETKYDMTLYYHQVGTDDLSHDYTATIDIDNVDWKEGIEGTPTFQSGKHYVVYVTVYGLEEIVVDIELEPWGYEGDVEIDPDDIPEAIEDYE